MNRNYSAMALMAFVALSACGRQVVEFENEQDADVAVDADTSIDVPDTGPDTEDAGGELDAVDVEVDAELDVADTVDVADVEVDAELDVADTVDVDVADITELDVVVVDCIDDDLVCPSGCNSTIDNDCDPECGNNILEVDEICDGLFCLTSCGDANACTTDVAIGAPETCDLVCTNTPVSACVDADECCPLGCDATQDTDCDPVCGNDVQEFGETCDAPSCPTSCSDGDVCTTDISLGSAADCDLVCTNPSILLCVNSDGCCPAGCDAVQDNDCSPFCGNDVVERGETCDPVASCPADCNDSNACTTDTLTGSAANCDVECTRTPVLLCADGDGCCPAACNNLNDDDCSADCGNGTVEAGETCDPVVSCPVTCDDLNSCTNDLTTGSAANCNVACSHTSILLCQDDDGCCPLNCDSTNDNDCSPDCGNEVVEEGETCDPVIVCPTTCDDLDSCTADMMTGSALTCNVACSHSLLVACEDNDGCCPLGCAFAEDDDCLDPCAMDPVVLGSAGSYAVLAGSTVTSTGLTSIVGDVGVSPGSAVEGFGPGIIVGAIHAGDVAAAAAIASLLTAYNDAAGRTLCPTGLAGNLGGLTLTPGLYKSTSSLSLESGALTLDGGGDSSAVFIIQIASALTTTDGATILLTNGANPANIYWQVGTSATFGSGTVFFGTVMADQSISFVTGATLTGRALARIGGVTMDSNVITLPAP